MRNSRIAVLAALLIGVLTLSGPVRTVASNSTLYVATSGTASAPGSSCARPGFVGTDQTPIQAAVDAAASGSVVVVCPGTYALSAVIDLSGVEVTLRGLGSRNTILDGGNTFGADGSSNNDGVQIVFSDGAATLDSLTLRNGFSESDTDSGGAANIRYATVINSRFEHNFATVPGGALHGYDLVIKGSQFESNTAIASGGAVHILHDALIESSTFQGNSASWDGGALSTSEGNGSVVIDRSAFNDNSSDSVGGAIYVEGASLTIANSVFARNEAADFGGAINNWSSTLPMRVTSSSFTSNTAGEFGGALNVYALTQIESSKFVGNSANSTSGGGGAINSGFVYGTTVSIKGSIFERNMSKANGGAVQLNFDPSVSDLKQISRNRFLHNTATGSGSAIFLSTCTRLRGGSLQLERTNLFSGNRGGRGNVEDVPGSCAG